MLLLSMIRTTCALSICVLSQCAAFSQAGFDAGYAAAAPHAGKGYTLFQAGKLDQAEEEYREAVKYQPGNADFWLGLAAVCVKRDHWDDAANAYKKVSEIDPNKIEILADYADALRRIKKYDEAVAAMKRA